MAEVEVVSQEVLNRNNLIKSVKDRDSRSDNRLIALGEWGVEHFGPIAVGMAVASFSPEPGTAAFYGGVRSAVSRTWELRQGLGQVMNRSHIREADGNVFKMVGGALKEADVFGGQLAVVVGTGLIGEKILGGIKKENRRKELYQLLKDTCEYDASGNLVRPLNPGKLKDVINANYGRILDGARPGIWSPADIANLERATLDLALMTKMLGRDLDLGAYAEQTNLKQIYGRLSREQGVAATDEIYRTMVDMTRQLTVRLKGYNYNPVARTKTSNRPAAAPPVTRQQEKLARKCTQLLASSKRGTINKALISALYVGGGAGVGIIKGASGLALAEYLAENHPEIISGAVGLGVKFISEAKQMPFVKDVVKPVIDSVKSYASADIVQDAWADLQNSKFWQEIKGLWEGKIAPNLKLPGLHLNGHGIPDAGHASVASTPDALANINNTAGHLVRETGYSGPLWGNPGAKAIWGPISQVSVDQVGNHAVDWNDYWQKSFEIAAKSPHHETLEALLKNTNINIVGLDSVIDKVENVPGYITTPEFQSLFSGLNPDKIKLLVEMATADPGAGKFTAPQIKAAVQELQHLWGQLPPGDKYANLIKETIKTIK